MRKGRLDNDLVGIAGVQYVAFELSRRGLVVLPTTRNVRRHEWEARRRGAKPFPCIYVQGKNVSSGLGEGRKTAWETWEL